MLCIQNLWSACSHPFSIFCPTLSTMHPDIYGNTGLLPGIERQASIHTRSSLNPTAVKWYREGSKLEFPRGGGQAIINALVRLAIKPSPLFSMHTRRAIVTVYTCLTNICRQPIAFGFCICNWLTKMPSCSQYQSVKNVTSRMVMWLISCVLKGN